MQLAHCLNGLSGFWSQTETREAVLLATVLSEPCPVIQCTATVCVRLFTTIAAHVVLIVPFVTFTAFLPMVFSLGYFKPWVVLVLENETFLHKVLFF